MMWYSALKRLLGNGVLGINRRNAECILDRNPRSLFPVVDDKLLMHALCERIGVPTPAIVGVFHRQGELRGLEPFLRARDQVVIKPARGSGGRGILILTGRCKPGRIVESLPEDGGFRKLHPPYKSKAESFLKANGRPIDFDGIRQHVSDILSGMFSLGGQPDRAIVQERVGLHPAFNGISPRGIPDVRLVLYRFEPAMAMLRLPTLESNGRANLHQGGIGVGVDLASGYTHHAVYRNRSIDRHPDTGEPLLDRAVPCWSAVVETACKTARAVGLGFVGIDIVIDERAGPMLLEANARPGLAIQLANNEGLGRRIEEIERQFTRRVPVE
jgi:hypothetical protein